MNGVIKPMNKALRDLITTKCIHPNFPKEGVNFLDIFPLMESRFPADVSLGPTVFEPIVFLPEARGFLFYSLLGPSRVVPMRKSGKLPGELVEIKYTKEYGDDTLFFQKDALVRRVEKFAFENRFKKKPITVIPVALFDDILATGGTAEAIINFLNNYTIGVYSFRVTTCRFYVELKDLNGRKKLEDLGVNVETYYQY